MRRFLQLCLFVWGLTLFSPLTARAHADYINYAFVSFETTVTRQGIETDGKHPEEQRVYVSNIVVFKEKDASVFRSAPKIADDYFTATVVDPMKDKGILHQYYDDGILINDKVAYALDGREAVEALREKVLEEYKERDNNVFTFTWTRTGKLNGLETSQPTLYYRDPDQPLYGIEEPQPDTPTPPHA